MCDKNRRSLSMPSARLVRFGFAIIIQAAGCLAVAEKNNCRTTADCSGTRACVDAQCTDDTCAVLCESRCTAARDCKLVDDLKCDQCATSQGLSSALAIQLAVPDDAQLCREDLEALDEDRCASTRCAIACQDVCTHAEMCMSITDTPACVRGCIDSGCDLGMEVPEMCGDDPVVASCYELRGLFGPNVLCNAQRPCETAGYPCSRQGHCCGVFLDTSVCAGEAGEATCRDICLASVECVSECCRPLTDFPFGVCGEGSTCL